MENNSIYLLCLNITIMIQSTFSTRKSINIFFQTVLESLDEYRKVPKAAVASGNLPPLVRMPPALQPMPCKPLFFDLALNHIQMPSLEEKIADNTKSSPPPGATGAEGQQNQAGLGSMVKGWFWGSGNK